VYQVSFCPWLSQTTTRRPELDAGSVIISLERNNLGKKGNYRFINSPEPHNRSVQLEQSVQEQQTLARKNQNKVFHKSPTDLEITAILCSGRDAKISVQTYLSARAQGQDTEN